MSHEFILDFFAKYIESELGIIYEKHNYFQLQNRLEDISKVMGIISIEKLYEEAQKGIFGQFKQLLIDVATNNETSFFRDIKIYKGIEDVVLESYKSLKNGKKINIWSAASSTGQEAISLAILINEWMNKNQIAVNFLITATDISERVLNRAKSGQYSQLEVQRGLPANLLIKYFTKDDKDAWCVKPHILSQISYRMQNLKSPYLFSEKFDLVLCRNVLIYQNVAAKIEILKKISAELSDNGYLILGSGESLLGLSTDFEQVAKEGVIIYRKRVKAMIAG